MCKGLHYGWHKDALIIDYLHRVGVSTCGTHDACPGNQCKSQGSLSAGLEEATACGSLNIYSLF